jgi:hypothetical protein
MPHQSPRLSEVEGIIAYDPSHRESVVVLWHHAAKHERLKALHQARISLNEVITQEEAKL